MHRCLGLLVAGFAVFYSLTGLALNHRQDLGYFQTKHKVVLPVKVQDQQLM